MESGTSFSRRRASAQSAGIGALAVLLSACSDDGAASPSAPTAADLGEQPVKPVADYLSAMPYADASEALGDRLLLECRSCHNLERGAGHRLGPNLYAVVGRAAGSADGFPYSAALRSAEFAWTPRALDAWLEDPSRFLPGTAMAFDGLADPGDRIAVIASLLRRTARAEAAQQERQRTAR